MARLRQTHSRRDETRPCHDRQDGVAQAPAVPSEPAAPLGLQQVTSLRTARTEDAAAVSGGCAAVAHQAVSSAPPRRANTQQTREAPQAVPRCDWDEPDSPTPTRAQLRKCRPLWPRGRQRCLFIVGTRRLLGGALQRKKVAG